MYRKKGILFSGFLLFIFFWLLGAGYLITCLIAPCSGVERILFLPVALALLPIGILSAVGIPDLLPSIINEVFFALYILLVAPFVVFWLLRKLLRRLGPFKIKIHQSKKRLK